MTRRNLELVEPLRAGARGLHPAGDDRRDRDADGRPAAAPVAALPAARAGRDRGASRRGGRRGRATAGAAPACARRSTASATSSGSPAAPPPAAPRRGSWARCATRSSGFPTWPRRWRRSRGTRCPMGAARRSSRRPSKSSTSWPISPASCTAALEDVLRPSSADGGVIRHGYDAELDQLRSLRDGGRQYIASLQQRERERTGISSLKVGFNKVFGYYLEITNAHAAKVPADYERRQTLANAERYVTPELKEYEAKVLGAEERMAVREAELFGALRAAGRARRSAGSSAPRGYSPVSTSGPRWRRWRVAGPLRPARGARWLRPGPPREPPPGGRADDAARGVRPQRRAVHRRRAGAPRHRPQHGRQVHHPPPDRPLRRAGADGSLRAGGGGVDRRGGPALHPRRARATTWRGGSPPSWWR